MAYAARMRPSTRLRLIAIHVEEPAAGAFRWVLRERGDSGDWAELERAPAAAGTYHQAMADGLLALQAMVDNLDTGPRRNSPHAGANAAPGDDVEQAPGTVDETPAVPKRRAFFGFGPAR